MDLSLAEQFVLLTHRPSGGHGYAAHFSGVAELGDLVLWRRIAVLSAKIQVIDTRPTGVAWLDSGIALLSSQAGNRNKPVSPLKFVGARAPRRAGDHSALAIHRNTLVQRDYARCTRERKLGLFSKDVYYPNPSVWEGAVGELRAFARQEIGADERLVLLSALAYETGISKELSLPGPERKQLKAISRSTDFGTMARGIVYASSGAG